MIRSISAVLQVRLLNSIDSYNLIDYIVKMIPIKKIKIDNPTKLFIKYPMRNIELFNRYMSWTFVYKLIKYLQKSVTIRQ